MLMSCATRGLVDHHELDRARRAPRRSSRRRRAGRSGSASIVSTPSLATAGFAARRRLDGGREQRALLAGDGGRRGDVGGDVLRVLARRRAWPASRSPLPGCRIWPRTTPRIASSPQPSARATANASSRFGPTTPFVPARASVWHDPHLATNCCLPLTRSARLLAARVRAAGDGDGGGRERGGHRRARHPCHSVVRPPHERDEPYPERRT